MRIKISFALLIIIFLVIDNSYTSDDHPDYYKILGVPRTANEK